MRHIAIIHLNLQFSRLQSWNMSLFFLWCINFAQIDFLWMFRGQMFSKKNLLFLFMWQANDTYLKFHQDAVANFCIFFRFLLILQKIHSGMPFIQIRIEFVLKIATIRIQWLFFCFIFCGIECWKQFVVIFKDHWHCSTYE